MSPVTAYYYDGKTAVRHRVSLRREGDQLTIHGSGVDCSYPIDSVRLSPGIAGVRRSLRLPGGALCEFADNDPGAELLGIKEEGVLHRMVFRWEHSIRLALLALLLTVAAVFCIIRYAVPVIARQVALAVPAATDAALGKDSLAFLDRYIMKPSTLSEARQLKVKQIFSGLQATLPDTRGYRIELRNAGTIGANAFALPGGTIVVTDQMVELARVDDELAGVLAHEAAHQRSRHALRQVLQNTATGLLIAALTGDITSIASLSATLPTALIDAGYSRAFEYEADDAAVDYLKKAGIKPQIYADMLARLQAEHDNKDGAKSSAGRWNPMALLSTHPETSERIRRVLDRTGDQRQ